MTSFRIAEEDLAAAQEWAERLGMERSELLRDAVRAHLAGLRAEADAAVWERMPSSDTDLALAEVADWGPAEDWSDWRDAAG